jgi:hypothetical protein
MIVAIEGLIPDRRSVSAQNKSAPPPVHPQIDTATWLREQQGKATVPHPSADLLRDEDGPSVPEPPPGAATDAPLDLGPAANVTVAVPSVSSSEMTPSSPYARVPDFAPGNTATSSIEKKPFTWRLRL